MYSKFKVDIKNYIFSPDLYDEGKNCLNAHKSKIKTKIDKFVDYDSGIIDGSALEKELFKEIDADIFLSHSHIDEDLAISFAGWLKYNFGLTAFVDSCVWEYAEDILLKINNKYNHIIENGKETKSYNYRKVNYAASHIYLMLNSALNNMINKTECFMFIDTNNSCFYMDKDDVNAKTLSPWIYSEIVMANTMNPSKQPRLDSVTEFAHREELKISHNLDFSTFINLNSTDLDIWKNNKYKYGNINSLDVLYRIKSKGNILNG